MEEIRIKWQRFAVKLIYNLTQPIKTQRDYRPYCKNCNHFYTGIGECVLTGNICWWV